MAEPVTKLAEPVISQVECGENPTHQVYKIKYIYEDGIKTKLEPRLDYGYCCQCQAIIAEPHKAGVN